VRPISADHIGLVTIDPDPPAVGTTSVQPAGVLETHSGVVFFLGDRAYKVKKPVDLGFLDFRTRTARLRACRREVALNRRLAPDVYLGVADVIGMDGEPCEHMVVMRRMPSDRRLSDLVQSGADVSGELHRLAELLAGFHATALRPPAAALAASASALQERWDDNLRFMASFSGTVFEAELLDGAGVLARRYLDGRARLFARRVTEGHAIDGHGDLLAEDIFCLDDGPRVLDCLEFDDGLRYGDALADVAFLAMDLEHLGRPDLARAFLDDYRALTKDEWPASLAHHHIAYRALVRAKVAALRAEQGDLGAVARAVQLLALAHHHLNAGRVRLVLVGGLPGTGKSTVAARLAAALGARVLHTDEIRKASAQYHETEAMPASFGQGAYTSGNVEATYEAMLRQAETQLSAGESVVLDATWLEPSRRKAVIEMAERTVADVSQLRCVLQADIAATRLRDRAAAGRGISDADPAIAAMMALGMRPWPEADVLDTNRPPAEVLAQALELLGWKR
jgi:hypothetical protein